ncbi:hypothetical protein [Burkholderia sp. MSMB2157WGS]|uniref:hypothetical protein n=1 Tax=Burkholderia sp. MSMB2157WGS TaxID=1637928 RepID=UPI000759C038|nr:hypothetical protein [Burkholderia sp. MSMB2157WGS]KWE57503.1 hypothetical protein WT53_16440 [Burkholderia sp. MSMB2157WGS]
MTTRILHSKIPHNLRVPRKTNKSKAARDAVAPSVRGIALRKIAGSGPVADALRKATKIAVGLDALVTAQKLAAETGDAELAALVNSPKLMKAVDRAIKRLGRDVDLFTNRPTEGDPNVTAGLIGDSRVQWHAMDHHTRLQMEQAAKKAAELRSTMTLDTAQNKVRAQFGLDPVPVDADTLYAMFGHKGKRSDV